MISQENLLTFSEELFEQTRSESDSVHLRACISRTYYYIYHSIRNRYWQDVRANFARFDEREHHSEIIQFFNRLNHHDIATKIARCQRKRKDADYELNKNINKGVASECIYDAKNIVGRIKRIGVKNSSFNYSDLSIDFLDQIQFFIHTHNLLSFTLKLNQKIILFTRARH